MTAPTRSAPDGSRTEAMMKGRQADSARRRQRVIAVLSQALADGTEISVSGIARAAAVDRTFLYRHQDLLALVHAAELEPAAQEPAGGSPVSRASLQADLANAQARNTRLAARIQQVEKRLSQALGAQAWQESGLGTPADIDELQRKITRLEQQNIERTATLEETRSDLDAARAANRELTRALNQRG